MEYGSDWVARQYIYNVGLEVRTQLFSCNPQGESDSFEIFAIGFDVGQHLANKVN